ncbi:MAG: rRNA maturation RNase YbeY [Planctomycetota bacterium]|nr:rRNA maturation RNase YbeY [Planctomycetota bacterium]
MPILMTRPDTPSEDDTSGGEPPEPPQPPQPEPASEVELLEIIDRTRLLGDSEQEFLRDGLLRLIEELGVSCHRCVLEIVDDRRMRLLHERWMNDPSTTDVLTFPMSAPDEPIDADIAICLPEAERRGRELGHDRLRELLLYGLHGILHVLGHDDRDQTEYVRMHAEEDRLLERIGLGGVFGPSDRFEEGSGS